MFLLTKHIKTYTIKYRKEENRRRTWLSQTLKKVESVVGWVRDKEESQATVSLKKRMRVKCLSLL